jgi:hypothetical protein
MKKILFIALFFSFMGLLSTAKAQFMLGVNTNAALSLQRGGAFGYGLGVSGHYFANDNVALGGTFQYGSGYFSSLMGSGLYFFSRDTFKPYAGLEGGAYLLGLGSGVSFTRFGFAPVLGASYEVADNLDITASLRYNFIFLGSGVASTYSYLPLQIGIFYNFN